jgi:recombinational DNA repair ATPase RecF
MKITKIEIENYKSIKEKIAINFNANFFGLLGFNGAGKSNILNAINIINTNDKEIKYSDICNRDNLDSNNKSAIRIAYFMTNLSDIELNVEIFEQLLKKKFTENVSMPNG